VKGRLKEFRLKGEIESGIQDSEKVGRVLLFMSLR
jgi:hypothetical protein